MTNKKWRILAGVVLLLGGGFFFGQSIAQRQRGTESQGGHGMMGQMMTDESAPLQISEQKEQKLAIPPLLEPTEVKGNHVTYRITAQAGSYQIKSGKKTQTLGYNGDFLGPLIRLKKGQDVTFITENQLPTATSFHWHGLKLAASADGGPHQVIPPGETKTVNFTVAQEAATLWFHPHPMGATAAQVYQGLAGLLYVEDDRSKQLKLPAEYGINDFPLIVQDKSFDEDNQLNYQEDTTRDGIQGDTLLVNGTLNPYLESKERWLRLRVVNGSNARNLDFSLAEGQPFYQIATDGGLLNQPVKMTSLRLSPGERGEILVDTQQFAPGESLRLLANQKTALTIKVKGQKATPFDSKETLNEIKPIAQKDLQGLKRQEITLKGMSHMVSINDQKFNPERIDLQTKTGSQEIWKVSNVGGMMGGMAHPFHLHGVQFQIISRNGQPPSENEAGWKDTVLVNPEEQVELLVTFEHSGLFMYHCHILEHEENGMMGQVNVV